MKIASYRCKDGKDFFIWPVQDQDHMSTSYIFISANAISTLLNAHSSFMSMTLEKVYYVRAFKSPKLIGTSPKTNIGFELVTMANSLAGL